MHKKTLCLALILVFTMLASLRAEHLDLGDSPASLTPEIFKLIQANKKSRAIKPKIRQSLSLKTLSAKATSNNLPGYILLDDIPEDSVSSGRWVSEENLSYDVYQDVYEL